MDTNCCELKSMPSWDYGTVTCYQNFGQIQLWRLHSNAVSVGCEPFYGRHTEALRPTEDRSSSNSNSDEAEETQVLTATTSSASDSAAADPPAQVEFSEVCLVAPREGFALVPCGHARFCESCALRVSELDAGCPVCRAQITMVLRLFQ